MYKYESRQEQHIWRIRMTMYVWIICMDKYVKLISTKKKCMKTENERIKLRKKYKDRN